MLSSLIFLSKENPFLWLTFEDDQIPWITAGGSTAPPQRELPPVLL